MLMQVRLRRNAFDHWIILHPTMDNAAWTGRHWAPIDKDGFPSSSFQISNLETEKEAADYAAKFGFTTSYEEERGLDRKRI